MMVTVPWTRCKKDYIRFFVHYSKWSLFLTLKKLLMKKTVILLKRRQFIIRLHRQIHDKGIRWDEKKQVILLKELILNK